MNTHAAACPEASADKNPSIRGFAWQGAFGLPLGLTVLFLSFTLLPRVYSQPRLLWTYVGVSFGLLLWQGSLFFRVSQRNRRLGFQFTPVKSHYVQALVQLVIYVYFGWHWPNIYQQAPLILSQIVFLYLFDLLLTWSLRDSWRLGFGPIPIILSTNLFIWFRDDWFVFQFLLVATGALGKQFIRWRRDGKTTHIFNPSAISLSLFSLVIIVTGTTHYTWGEELALMLGAPKYIYTVVFGLGLIVQFLFSVTLMTLSAAVSLILLNIVYTAVTGVYLFVDSNIPIAVFLGLHLLMTDPSTSPRTDVGKVIFGSLYGLGVFVVYSWLFDAGAPRFYDKLLAVPLLNLSVPWLDRLATRCVPETIARWRTTLRPETLNRCYMGVWVIVFGTMLSTGFVQARHPGESIAFWKQACENGQPRGCRNLLAMLHDASVRGSGEAFNELGIMSMEGKHVEKNPAQATHYFAESCRLKHAEGCANASIQYLFHGVARTDADAAKSLEFLEHNPAALKEGRAYYLLGFAYENGRGRPLDLERAQVFYSLGCNAGDVTSCKQMARMSLHAQASVTQRQRGAAALEKACSLDDAESCQYLAQLYHTGSGVQPDETRARSLLEKACRLGAKPACTLLETLKK